MLREHLRRAGVILRGAFGGLLDRGQDLVLFGEALILLGKQRGQVPERVILFGEALIHFGEDGILARQVVVHAGKELHQGDIVHDGASFLSAILCRVSCLQGARGYCRAG